VFFFSITFYEQGSIFTSGNIYFEPNLWNPFFYLMVINVVAVFLLIAALLVARAIRQVNLAGLVRYYWALRWLLPIELFCAIGLFDFHKVTEVVITHWFNDPSLEWFRDRYCEKPCNTQEEEYMAEQNLSREMRVIFYCNFVLGMVIALLLFLTMQLLENIVSSPVIRRSKEINISAWLLLPCAGSAWAGWTLRFAEYSSLFLLGLESVQWIGIMYLVVSGAFAIAILFAVYIGVKPVLSPGDKKRKQLAIFLFIIFMIAASLACIAVFSTSLLYSSKIVDINIPNSAINKVNCLIYNHICCLNKTESCPEWCK